MIIRKSEAIRLLNDENAELATKGDQAAGRVSAIEGALSQMGESAGLSGDGYTSFAEYVRRLRLPALQQHVVAYESLALANASNIAALEALTGDAGGVIDTDELAGDKDELDRRRQELEDQMDDPCFQGTGNEMRALRLYSAAQGIQAQIDATMQYASTSASLYSEAQEEAERMAQASDDVASASFVPGQGWSLATIGDWSQDVDTRYVHARALDWLRDNGSDDQCVAYAAALADGALSADDIYGEDSHGFDASLYSALAHLPDDLVADSDVTAAAGAYLRMWASMDGSSDTGSIDRLLECSYLPNGESVDLSKAYKGPDYQDPHFTGTTYGMERCSLLGRMAKAADGLLKQDDADDPGYWMRVQGANVISGLASDDNAALVRSTSADHADIDLTVLRAVNVADEQQSYTTASAVVICFVLPGLDGLAYSVTPARTHTYVAGNATDAVKMLQGIRKSKANFDVQSSLADHATDALKKHIIRSGGDGIEKVLTQALAASAADMEAVSKAISTSIDILSSTWDDFVDYVESVQDGAITGIETDVATNASKGIMTKVGVGFDLSGEPDYGRLLTNPDGVYTTDTVDRVFDDLANEYASETGKTVTGGKMREMLSMNFSFAITGRDLAEEATYRCSETSAKTRRVLGYWGSYANTPTFSIGRQGIMAPPTTRGRAAAW